MRCVASGSHSPMSQACETTRVPGFSVEEPRPQLLVEIRQEVERHHRRPREILLEDVALDDGDLARDAGALGVAPRERRKLAGRTRCPPPSRRTSSPRRSGAARRRRPDRRQRRRSWSSPSPASARPSRPAWAATSRPCPAGAGAGDRARRRIAGNPVRRRRRRARGRRATRRAAATGTNRRYELGVGRRQRTCGRRRSAQNAAHCSISSPARAAPRIGSTRSWNLRARSASVIGRSRLPIACSTNMWRRAAVGAHDGDVGTTLRRWPRRRSRPRRGRAARSRRRASTIVVGELGLARLAEQDARGGGVVDAELALEARAAAPSCR